MREAVKKRETWQKRGVAFFESFWYVLLRSVVIWLSFLLAYISMTSLDKFILKQKNDHNYALLWTCLFCFINLLLLIDLVLAFVFYGGSTLWKAKIEFIYEIAIQVMFLVLLILYIIIHRNAWET